MGSGRIVVVVPGAEGGWMVRALARESLAADQVAAAPIVSEGAVLVVDREVPALGDWLEAFEGEAILVGWEPPTDDELARLDVVAFYPRPVHLAGLIRRIQTLLAGAQLPSTPSVSSVPPPSGVHDAATRELEDMLAAQRETAPETPEADATLHDSEPRQPSEPPETADEPIDQEALAAPDDAPADHGGVDRSAPARRAVVGGKTSAVDSSPPRMQRSTLPAATDRGEVGAPPPREPTVRLRFDDGGAPRPSEPPVASRAESSIPPRGEDGPETLGESSVPPTEGEPSGERAVLSPHLASLLEKADRRLFPEDDRLDLTFPAGDEAPEVLVPDDLLANSSTPLDPREADPLEAFTFVGTPDLLDTASGNLASTGGGGEGSEPELTPHTVVERASRPPPSPSDRPPSSAGTGSGVDLAKEGTTVAGGALRMAFDLVQRRRPFKLRLAVAGGPEVELRLEGESVLGVRGPWNQEACEAFTRSGRLDVAPGDEEAAAEALDAAIRRGRLTAYEKDRACRLAIETILGRALLAAEARYEITSADPGSPEASPVAGTFSRVAVEQARLRVDADTALRWLGASEGDRLGLETSFASRARLMGLAPEVTAAFVRAAGRTIGELLEAPVHAGLAGALFALASAELVRVETGTESHRSPSAAERAKIMGAAIERAGAIAEEGSYHAILGLSPGAAPRMVELARRDRLSELAGDLEELGLEHLHPARSMAIDAIEEAAEVLAHPRWAQLYARSISLACPAPSGL